MSNIVYLNGTYLPREQAQIPIEDRGLMFADGVYEVVRYYNAHPISMQAHLDRLDHSLKAIRIDLPADATRFDQISTELLRRNQLKDATVYWQVSRGVAPRTHRFPDPPVEPTCFAIATAASPLQEQSKIKTMRAITHPDQRWGRCDIKSICLLPNILAQQVAIDQGCDDAILVKDDHVTEATCRSLFFVFDGRLHTHPLTPAILPSITRNLLLDQVRRLRIELVESPIPKGRIFEADEIFLSSTTRPVSAVIEVDGKPIANRQVGPISQRLHEIMLDTYAKSCNIELA